MVFYWETSTKRENVKLINQTNRKQIFQLRTKQPEMDVTN